MITFIESLLSFAQSLADEAARMVAERLGAQISVTLKPDRSFVTELDQAIEARLRERIADRYPDHGILGYPKDGTFTTPEFLVLAKDAPNGAIARRAFDHIISKDVQITLLENAFRRPSRSDIDVSRHAELPNLSAIKVFDLDENDAAAKRNEFPAEWQAMVAAAR